MHPLTTSQLASRQHATTRRPRRATAMAALALLAVTATACRAPYARDGQAFRQLESVDLVPGDATNTVPAGATSFTVRLTPGGQRAAQLDFYVGIGGADSYRWNEPDGGANAVPGVEIQLAQEVLGAQPTPATLDLTVDLAALRSAGLALTPGDHVLCVMGAISDTSSNGQGSEYFPWRHCDTVRIAGAAPVTPTAPTSTAAPTTTAPATTAPATSTPPAFVRVPEPAPAIRPAGTFGAVSLANDADGDADFGHHEQAAAAGATVPVRFTVQNPGTISLFVQSVSVLVDGVPVAAPDCASWAGATVDPTHGFTCDVQVTAPASGITRTVEALVSLSQMSAPFGVAESADSTEITTR